ncbi:head-tail connector protein [Pseudomonas sp. PS01296]|uniref:head-tail connector protein n=1 Tax=Pseudomonas sp. PS01296 TaxID=2991432 RepID=UPI00249B4EBD|nr:head-tail connector protein [Pseudomonas sp. PS01296]
MSAIDIALAMQHLRAEVEDQAYVQALLSAAEDSAAQYIQRQFYADAAALESAVLSGTAGADPIVITGSIVAACLLILGHLYGNREDVVVGTISIQVPMGSRTLLGPYRVGLGV